MVVDSEQEWEGTLEKGGRRVQLLWKTSKVDYSCFPVFQVNLRN